MTSEITVAAVFQKSSKLHVCVKCMTGAEIWLWTMDSQWLGGRSISALKDLLTTTTEESDSDDDFKVCEQNVHHLLLTSNRQVSK